MMQILRGDGTVAWRATVEINYDNPINTATFPHNPDNDLSCNLSTVFYDDVNASYFGFHSNSFRYR